MPARKLPRTPKAPRPTEHSAQQEIALDPNSPLQTARRSRGELQREIVPRLAKLASGEAPALIQARSIFFPLTTWAPVPLLEKIINALDKWDASPPSPTEILARAEVWESERKSKVNR